MQKDTLSISVVLIKACRSTSKRWCHIHKIIRAESVLILLVTI